MRPELATRRRILRLTLQRYVEADRAWQEALVEMKRWFPRSASPYAHAIGNPGSRVRRSYDARTRALLQFEAAHVKFETARQRLAGRTGRHTRRVLVLSRIDRD